MSKIMIFIPMYNCATQIGRVVKQFTPDILNVVEKIIFIDNRSTDGTLTAAGQAAMSLPVGKTLILQNRENYGLGGSHKVAFNYALDHNYTHVIVFHGDDQGHIADILPSIHQGDHIRHNCLLGSRFMTGSRRIGYSTIRTLANFAFNLLFSAITFKWILDVGSGLNMYSRECLEGRHYLRYVDNLTFNHFMLLGSVASGADLKFVPISWREEDQISNARLLHLGSLMLLILVKYVCSRQTLLKNDHSERRNGIYEYKIITGEEN